MLLLTSLAFAGGKVEVEGLPVGFDSPCPSTSICTKKADRALGIYDPRVVGNAKFAPGEVVLANGVELKGQVALLGEPSDWSFVKTVVLLIPDGQERALYLGGGDALRVERQGKKETKTFDRYGGGYLERRVSGPYRLWFNPAAGTSKGVFDIVSENVLNDLRQRSAAATVKASMKDGNGVRASLEAAKAQDELAMDVLSSIEITEKEYLIHSAATDELRAITEASWPTWLEANSCDAADAKTVKGFAKKYKAIDEAIVYLNATCS